MTKTMPDLVFEDLTKQILNLSYDQIIVLMGKLLESLKTKKAEENYSEMESDITKVSMNAMWEELKNDTW